MSRVHWAELAANDLAAIRTYHAGVDEQVRQMVIDRIVLATDWLLDRPLAGPEIGASGWRKWTPRRSAHVPIYRPIEEGIEISRVRHERENWMDDL